MEDVVVTDLTHSGGLASLAQVFGVGGVFTLVTLLGVFWTLHRHGGSLAVYLQARGASLEKRINELSEEVKKCHEERLQDRARWEIERDDLLATVNDRTKAVEMLIERWSDQRKNHNPLFGGKRRYDPQ